MTDKKQKPEIELFMYSLHQEFPEGVSHDSFNKHHVETRDILTETGETLRAQRFIDKSYRPGIKENDWPAQWLHAKWVTDHTKAITGIFERPDADPLCMALTRSESFGGVVYDPFSDKVYKVNEAGLALFREMQAASKAGANPAAVKAAGVEDADVKEFAAFLKGAGLWKK